jgi:glycerol-3-phosphate dehydrogenase (NAD(P)+)
LWTWQREHAEELQSTRTNQRFLPNFPLPDGVSATHDLEAAVEGAGVVLVAVPTLAVRATLESAGRRLSSECTLVLASKGIETGSLMLLTDVVGSVLAPSLALRAVALSGPSFAQEVARGLPTNLVAACFDEASALRTQRLLAGERLRVYTSADPIGVQVGGALKNVIAIAAGASDGLGFGHNTRAALITRGLAEMARLSVAMGGESMTLAGLAGLGDLVLTATADLSRNRTVGFELARGQTLEQVLGGLGHVAEGVTTAKSAHDLALKLGIELPISMGVYRVLYEDLPVKQAVRELLSRPPGKEWP